MKTYIDCGQSCNECGCQFCIRVYKDESYEYLEEPCECESNFSPCDGELSISEAIKVMK